MKQLQKHAKAKARIKAVKARVLDLCVKKDKTIRQASAILKVEGFVKGVSRTRVGAALQEIAKDMTALVPREREKAYNRLQRYLDQLEEAQASGGLNLRASISDSLQVMDRLSRLLGLDAPTKAISAVVTTESGAAFEFLRCSHGLSDAQLQGVYEAMKALPREKQVIDATYFPTEEPKQLEETNEPA